MGVRAMSRGWVAGLSGLVLVGGSAGLANADPGRLTMTGNAVGTLTLPPASATAISGSFTLVATFDWSSDLLPPGIPVSSYPATLSFTIGGNGPYVSVPAAADAVWYQDGSLLGSDAVEIDTHVSNILEAFSTETWDATTQSFILSGLVLASSAPPFNIQLAGGGSLEIDSFSDLGPTASIYAPEPGTLGLLGFSVAAIRLLQRRRKV